MGKRNVYWVKQFKNKRQKANEHLYLNRERNQRFYHSKEWQAVRLYILGFSPICQYCNDAISDEVHHEIPINTSDGWSCRLDLEHLKALCKSCHSIETRREQTERYQQQARQRIEDNMNDLNSFD